MDRIEAASPSSRATAGADCSAATVPVLGQRWPGCSHAETSQSPAVACLPLTESRPGRHGFRSTDLLEAAPRYCDHRVGALAGAWPADSGPTRDRPDHGRCCVGQEPSRCGKRGSVAACFSAGLRGSGAALPAPCGAGWRRCRARRLSPPLSAGWRSSQKRSTITARCRGGNCRNHASVDIRSSTAWSWVHSWSGGAGCGISRHRAWRRTGRNLRINAVWA